MPQHTSYDAIVIGSGPNGLAAGITLARAGKSVLLYEAAATVGGGMRSAELTLPGFTHDVCSTIHALGAASPFFLSVPLQKYGVEWVAPDAPAAHPLDDGTAAVQERSLELTARGLGEDGGAYMRFMKPFVENAPALFHDALGPLKPPRHPMLMARFGFYGLQPATGLASRLFRGEKARALFAGMAAHAIMPLEHPLTGAFGLILGVTGHVTGWPVARGGSQKLADGLTAYFKSLGGEVVTGAPVTALKELPSAKAVLCDISPRQLDAITGGTLPSGYRRALNRFRFGPGVFKMDWALSGPIPWKAKECSRAGTVHLGGTMAEVARGENEVWRGGHPERPFVLVTQPSLFDGTRAPEGRHTAWAYCHVPHGSAIDMSSRIEAQIERFAPGFGDLILGRHAMSTKDFQTYNANYIGGDINGGVPDLRQLYFRPVMKINPYATPLKGVYLCSASTPPGGGVHGMGGYHAAEAALRTLFK